ncbi:putative fatty acyl-CoA reductase CG5065 [Musca domestica]|uniref:Fatty acyl-CoA reductase n=1 Tax=Musca domestica TaxID=7370 RepID=A0A9J7D234_MUSDO|nr:putative fatty acyl-CoA reductase CG5065 [Musca domestica]
MSIAQFYAGKEILITGGSGFIGKVLIEKILRSLPNVGKVYILLRSKKAKNASQRLEEILQIPLFRHAREEQPEAFKKLIAIDGDCQELGLGISSLDMVKIRNVNIIFHVAATVRFDDDMKTSIILNTRGTHEILKLALNLPKLKSFVHVSTTYSHPNLREVDEKMYAPYVDWRTAIKIAETYDQETLNMLLPKFSPEHPNSYTLSKNMAEHIVEEYSHKLPAVIFRPSIVVSSFREPFPGWIDNFNGPVGMFVACGIGIMRTNHADPDIKLDLIPVDMVAKALLVTGYKHAKENEKVLKLGGELEVYNCCASSQKRLTMADIINLGKATVFENPYEKCIWLPEGSVTRCVFWHYLRFFGLQVLPAILLDCLIRLSGHPPVLMRLQRRIKSTAHILNVFSNTEWQFNNDKLKSLENLIGDDERSVFTFMDYCSADMAKYMWNSSKGAKEFLLKESPISSTAARVRVRIYWVLHHTIQYIGLYYIIKKLLRLLYKMIVE